MSALRVTCRIRLIRSQPGTITRHVQRRTFADASRHNVTNSNTKPALFAVPSCPAPTCRCAATPPNLDIDRKLPLNGSMAAHSEHVLIATGRDDWVSRIEDGNEADSPGVGLVQALKASLGRHGQYANPYHNIMISNSSFAPAVGDEPGTASALLLPSFLRVSQIPCDQPGANDFLKGYLLPNTLHPSYRNAPQTQQEHLRRDSSRQARFQPHITPVREIVVLICGHGGRDERCGIMGPLLRTEFLTQLRNAGIRAGPQFADFISEGSDAVVGLVSHIGGHKFAGNVIVYIPPSMPDNRLAGKGIWYGRVEPKHVEGIVRETIQKATIIQDLFRGGLGPDGELLRL